MGGPTTYSQLEVVQLVERLTDRKLMLDYMSLDQIDSALVASTDPLKQSYLGLYRGLAVGDCPSADWAAEFGMTPTPLQACLQRMWTVPGSSNTHRSLS
jgi:hypothetical protein